MLVLLGKDMNELSISCQSNIEKYSAASSDDTLIVATKSPAAVQCISWNPQQVSATQTSVLNKLNIMKDDKTGKVGLTLSAVLLMIW